MSAPADPPNRPTLAGAVGILLAAGAGRRMGRPKALVVSDDGEPWLVRGVRVLREGGCADVVVVLGAEAARARALLASPAADAAATSTAPVAATLATVSPTVSSAVSSTGTPRITVVDATDWRAGIGASLRAGLAAVAKGWGEQRDAVMPRDNALFAVVTLVDLPELRPAAIRRAAAGATDATLRQASYAGRPGHPVVIGAAHFAALAATLEGDVGARPYLRAHGVEAVDCTDLGGGDDVDAPPLRAG